MDNDGRLGEIVGQAEDSERSDGAGERGRERASAEKREMEAKGRKRASAEKREMEARPNFAQLH